MQQWIILVVSLFFCAVAAALVMRHRHLIGELEARSRSLRERTGELERAGEELRTTQAALAQNERLAAVGELAAVVAHEVRNPLAVISNAVSGLRKSEISRVDQLILLDIVQEETVRLNRLVSDLLHYARPVKLALANVNLGELLERSVARVRAEEPTNIRVDLCPEAELASADSDLLCMIFDNLIDNAMQAIRDGGFITVRVHRETRDDKPGITVAIVDTGHGMNTAVRRRAKDAFFTTRPSGTGLGLAIVERIVQAHGGQFELASKAGEGTTATVFLPEQAHIPEGMLALLRRIPSPPPSSEEPSVDRP